MRRWRLMAVAGAAALVVAASISACSGGAAASMGPVDPGLYNREGAPAGATAAAAPIGGQNQSTGDNGPKVVTPVGTGPADNITKPEDAIVKTGSIRLQVVNLDDSVNAAADAMHGLGGYLAGSERSRGDTYSLASVTYRVPAARFEDAVAAARKLGKKVVSEHTETTPVGGQIVDLQARIDNLKSSEKAVQTIMARASSIPDVLTVESRLSDLQGQIEQLTAQLTSLSDQASYSTLTLEFEVPDPNATPTPSASPAGAWSVGHEFDQAAGALATVAQAGATVGIWFVVVILPIGLVALLLFLIVGVIWRVAAPLRRRFATATQPVAPQWPSQPPTPTE